MLTTTEIRRIAECVKKEIIEDLMCMSDELMNSKQCAAWLCISVTALHKRVERGEIPHTRKGKVLYFSKNRIKKDYLKDKSTP